MTQQIDDVSPFRLPSTGRALPFDDAVAAVIGYARATRPLSLRGQGTHAAGDVEVPLFAYQAYDCVPASSEQGFSWLDVLIVDSLNGKLRHPVITALRDAADRAWPHVAQAVERAGGRNFWDLPAAEVGRRPLAGTTGESLNRAWEECMRTDEVGVALTHKLLHHKQPELFPLIDGKTSPLLNQYTDPVLSGLWAVLHAELSEHHHHFSALEDIFAALIDGKDDVALNRLRLHDMLLWLVATGNLDFAVTRGRETAEWRRYRDNRAEQSANS